MSKISPFPEPDEIVARDRASLDAREAAKAIHVLLTALSPRDRGKVLRELSDLMQSIPAPQAGPLLGAIVQFLPLRREWTVAGIKQEVAASGVAASPKEIHNAVGYLTRKRHMRRIGYGRYLVDGGLLVTVDEEGGEPARYED